MSYYNEEAEIAKEWRDAAVLDGWTIKPTYDIENQDRASTLTKDGFTAMILYRTENNGERPGTKYSAMGSINIWGPDSLTIEIITPYNWQSILDGLEKCSLCGKNKVKTMKAGSANRVCTECLPMARKKLEYPGWCD